MTTEEILKKYEIELIYDHAIYFKKLEDTAHGVLAEDTNYMIKNINRFGMITIEEIEKNLNLLEKIIKEEVCH